MGTLEDAIALAVEKHRGQRDKNGRPYILHPLRVLHRLDWNTPDAAKIAAVLHDVVEDTDVTLDELRERGFPEEALQAIGVLTKRDGESYPQFIERLLPNRIARMVKRADLEDNMDCAVWLESETKSASDSIDTVRRGPGSFRLTILARRLSRLEVLPREEGAGCGSGEVGE
jgi:hypothetical protein